MKTEVSAQEFIQDDKSMDLAWKIRIVRSETVRPGKLKPNPKNPKIHPEMQTKALGESISDIGFVKRVLASNRTNVILDGEDRWILASHYEEQGKIAPIPTDFLDLEEWEEEYVLANLDAITALAELDNARYSNIYNNLLSRESSISEDIMSMMDNVNRGLLETANLVISGEDAVSLEMNDLNKPFGVNAKSNTDRSLKQDSTTKKIVWTMGLEEYEEVQTILKEAKRDFGTKNVSDTLLEIVRRAV